MNRTVTTTLRYACTFACAAAGLLAAAPASAQATPPPAEAPAGAETVDIGALGVKDESQAAGENERPLQLYGFADFTYYLPFFPRDSFLAAQVPENQQFVMGHFNLYLAKEISERLRTLGEVRFLYLPNGSIDNGSYTSTQVDDPANLYRPIKWAGIAIQRLYVEYDLLSSLTLRAGQYLTPYGIWNVDHGTPTLIGIRPPYVIGEALFPESQVGLELIGRRYFSEFGIEYHLTLSNGRSPASETRDLDNNKAVGARVVLQWKREFDLRVGFSFYRGMYTDRSPREFDPTTGKSTSVIYERYDEQAIAADVSLDLHGLVFRGEVMDSDHRYDDNFRGLGPTFTPDNRQWGFYGLLGYRLPYGVLPFVLAEYYKFPQVPGNDVIDSVIAYQAGINYRLHPSVILKLEYTYATLPNSPYSFISDTPLQAFESQVSWVF